LCFQPQQTLCIAKIRVDYNFLLKHCHLEPVDIHTMKWYPHPVNPFFYLHAGLNQLFFPLRSAIGWKGRRYIEKPAGMLPDLSNRQQGIINNLKQQYGVAFEASLNEVNTLRNYHWLHLMDEIAEQFQWKPPAGIRLVDVGSKNFYYAPALHAFFRPKQLVGIEIDGYHLYRGFYSNASMGDYYAKTLSNTAYQTMNFKAYHTPVDGIVWFFPFVLKEDVVQWYLPLETFEPGLLFCHARRILSPGGFLFMVNTGEDEFLVAKELLCQAGFSEKGIAVYSDGLLPKKIIPYVSLWVG
jgi:hypothetical protein